MSSAPAAEGAASPRGELRRVVSLALPVIVAELGWMFMGVVDTMMVGPLGPVAIAGVSIGNAIFDVPAICGIGLLLGLDTLVSQAYGADKLRECAAWLWEGVYLALIVSPLMMAAVFAAVPLTSRFGVNQDVLALAQPYLAAVNWSLIPLLVYAALRRYLQGISLVRPVMFALVTANAVNAVGNWLLIGRYGVAGVAWSTVISRIYMAGALALYIYVRDPSVFRTLPRPSASRFRDLLRLGLPAAGQILLEVGVFATATVLAGRLHPEAIAAHHIVLNIAGTTFMVPLGISSAGAVVVGQAIGRRDLRAAKRSGWMAIGLGAGFMAFAALVFVIAPRLILGAFTTNGEVLSIAVPLVFIAGVFQIFDGTQVTATGVLRGAGDTKTPMFANLMAHWLLALPSGYVLCFIFGWGVWGLWSGLCIGLIAVAAVLLFAWSRILPSHNW
jgi:MATE family multidrug resistance protein